MKILIINNKNNIDNENNYQSFKYLPNKLNCLLLHKIVKKSRQIELKARLLQPCCNPVCYHSGSVLLSTEKRKYIKGKTKIPNRYNNKY